MSQSGTLSRFLPAAFAFFLCLSAGVQAQTPKYDLLLKGGHVIDPANHIDGAMDVAVSGEKSLRLKKTFPPPQAGKVVDVSGLYVTPGLIDIHYHIGVGGAPLNWFTRRPSHARPLRDSR